MSAWCWQRSLHDLAKGHSVSNSNKGKRVLVTGGSRGIGAAIVRTLGASGYDVEFIFHASKDPAEALLQELQTDYREQSFSARQVDLGERAAVDAFVEQLLERDAFYGFVHNAGQSYDTLAALVDQTRAQAIMQVNFWSLTRLITALVRPMTRARAGRIVNIGSVTAVHGVTGNSIYAATKGAALSYLRTLAVELAPKGVTANTIAPGFVDTDLLSQYTDHREKIEKQIPVRRYAQADEVAGLVRYLLSPEAAYVTGSLLPIDGGLMASLGGKR
jgi:3-oxoacyl-[acyl-carrier protein] reductase